MSAFASLLQGERVQGISGADDDVLATVDQKRLGTVARVRAEAGVPQRLAVRRVIRDEIAAAVVAEQESTGRAEQPHRTTLRAARTGGERTRPLHLTGLV